MGDFAAPRPTSRERNGARACTKHPKPLTNSEVSPDGHAYAVAHPSKAGRCRHS